MRLELLKTKLYNRDFITAVSVDIQCDVESPFIPAAA